MRICLISRRARSLFLKQNSQLAQWMVRAIPTLLFENNMLYIYSIEVLLCMRLIGDWNKWKAQKIENLINQIWNTFTENCRNGVGDIASQKRYA